MGNVQSALLLTWQSTNLLMEKKCTVGQVSMAKAICTKLVREAAA